MSEELKPCPFCADRQFGKMDMTFMHATGPTKGVRIKCQTCGAQAPDTIWNRRAQPAEAEGVDRQHIMDSLLMWNRRHETPPITVGYEYGVAGAVLDMVGAALSAERTRADVAVADANDAERALAAVTAERDRLREEVTELWRRIDKFQSQSHGITALAEIERLRAESEALRADAERFRWLAHQGDACQWMNIIRVDPDDFESYAEAVDAAMAAKDRP